MIARIQIPKGWRRLRAGETVNSGDRYLTWDLKEWIRADMLAGSVLRTADYGAIRRVKRKRAKWVEVDLVQWQTAACTGVNDFRFSDKAGKRLMTFEEWQHCPINTWDTRFWLRRGAR